MSRKSLNHSTDAAVILSALFIMVRSALRRDRVPVVVFDVDGCLLCNSFRTLEIFRRFLPPWEVSPQRARFDTLDRWKLPYSPQRIYAILQGSLHLDPLVEVQMMSVWRAEFLAGTHLHLDQPLPGAPEFLRKLLEVGCRIVYLTGRHTPDMEPGTLQSFETHGFPLPDGEKVRAVFKPAINIPDEEFKTEAFQTLCFSGEEVVGFFDNEPGNVNAAHQRFPTAMSVHTTLSAHVGPVNWSDGAPSVHLAAYVLESFVLEGPITTPLSFDSKVAPS